MPVEDGLTTRDSLIGVRFDGARFAVPRDSVAFVESRKVSVVRSVGAGVGGVLVAASALIVIGFVALLSELE